MSQSNILCKYFFLHLFFLFFVVVAFSQEKKVSVPSTELFNEIKNADSVMFNAFNTQQMELFKSYFTADLEWFQDNGGLISYKTVFENFAVMFKNEHKLTRQLVHGTLEVHPIKNYGAIEIGTHQFRHFENGKEETGTFKFLMIWKKSEKGWQISRVVSYDH